MVVKIYRKMRIYPKRCKIGEYLQAALGLKEDFGCCTQKAGALGGGRGGISDVYSTEKQMFTLWGVYIFAPV